MPALCDSEGAVGKFFLCSDSERCLRSRTFEKQVRKSSFIPVVAPDTRVLVLGSLPGEASLAAQRYYAHPRNAFWPIMGELCGARPELPYEERCERLVAVGVAVWDVLKSCRRVGSLDTAIERDSEQPNDFAKFFKSHPRLRLVAFNGQKAEIAFRRHVLRTLDEATRRVTFDGEPLELSPLEYRMVALFVERKGQVVTPLELASHVQGRDDDAAKNAVEAMIARLRKKTESGAIETRRGFGYVLPDGPA